MKNKFNEFAIGDELLKAIDALGYKEPSEVQEKVIPEILSGRDVIVRSQTGSGKTASFVVPLCEKVEWEENKPQALILAPTRELAVQVQQDVINIGRFKRIKGLAVYGKSPFAEQARALKGKNHIVIGTPGRVMDHIEKGTLDLSKVKYLVIDEADEMLNMGFIDQVEDIIKRVPKNRVTMLFSATLSESIQDLCLKHMNNPKSVEIKATNLIADGIEHQLLRVRGDKKLETLKRVLQIEVPETAVIFCRTKENVEETYNYLNAKRYSVGMIHGGLLQKERLQAMESFKRGSFRYLVATDVAARGIDVEGLSYVINLDIPLEKEAYVHRIGRTGRAGKEGKAITFVTPYEDRFLEEIQSYIKLEISERQLEGYIDVEKAEEVLKSKPKPKEIKSKKVSGGITKIYLNGGRKKKIRAVDLVGTICNIPGLTSEDIGIIDIQDMGSYVDILNGKGNTVIDGLRKATIKGKKLKVERARN